MREKRGFGERTATRESAQPIQKYFLVFEGEKTELIDVIRKCERYGFDLYVTNPCFEFWLLLHFDGCDVLDREKLLCNYKTNGRSYTEKELSSRLGGYKKNRYNADGLMDRIDQAIENEKMFCEDVLELRESVGCNIGKLMTQMRERSHAHRAANLESATGVDTKI